MPRTMASQMYNYSRRNNNISYAIHFMCVCNNIILCAIIHFMLYYFSVVCNN